MLTSIIIAKLAIANYKPHCYEEIDLCNNVFAVFASGVKGKHALDVRVKSLSTSPDWKRNTYDASLAWYLKTEKFSPIVEFGYRYLDSRTKGIDNYGNAYLTIGLRY